MYGIFNRINSKLSNGDVSLIQDSSMCRGRQAREKRQPTMEYRSLRKADNVCHKIIKHSEEGQLVKNLKSLVDKIGLKDVRHLMGASNSKGMCPGGLLPNGVTSLKALELSEGGLAVGDLSGVTKSEILDYRSSFYKKNILEVLIENCKGVDDFSQKLDELSGLGVSRTELAALINRRNIGDIPREFKDLIDKYGSPVNDLVDGIPKDCSKNRLESYKSIVFEHQVGIELKLYWNRNGLDFVTQSKKLIEKVGVDTYNSLGFDIDVFSHDFNTLDFDGLGVDQAAFKLLDVDRIMQLKGKFSDDNYLKYLLNCTRVLIVKRDEYSSKSSCLKSLVNNLKDLKNHVGEDNFKLLVDGSGFENSFFSSMFVLKTYNESESYSEERKCTMVTETTTYHSLSKELFNIMGREELVDIIEEYKPSPISRTSSFSDEGPGYYINEYGSYISTTGGMNFLKDGDPEISYMS